MHFSRLLDSLRTARDPYGKGKPRENNTWLHLEGTFSEPQRIDLRHHRTHIMRFYPDGTREIHTGWTSSTTLARIREYDNVYIGQKYLVSVNGYRPSSERAYFITAGDGYVPFNAVDTYIRITSDNKFDMSTVAPWDTRCITHPKELRKTMRHLSKCAALLRGYAKLADNENCFQDGDVQINEWFMKHIDVPLEDVKIEPHPLIFVSSQSSIKKILINTLDDMRWAIADQRGWTAACKIMECR